MKKIFVLFITILAISCEKDKNSSGKSYKIDYQTVNYVLSKEDEKSIVENVNLLISYIKSENIEGVINLPYSKYPIAADTEGDSYPYEEFSKNLRQKKHPYNMLFNSKAYYFEKKESLDIKSARVGAQDLKLCIRDVILKYPDFRIKSINVQSKDSIAVYFFWVGKEKSESQFISYRCMFTFQNNKWVFSSTLIRS